MAVETPPATATAPASRGLTDGFYQSQGIATNGFTTPDESIRGALSGNAPPREAGAEGRGRVTAADRAAGRNKVGEADKTMFNQLTRFDSEEPSSAAQGTISATQEYSGNFAGQKFKP